MRKRLIELIDEYTEPLSARDIHQADFSEKFADHLLEGGVIVPPCKVGDTLYFLYNSPYADKPDLTPRIYKTNDWYFEVDKAGIAINTSDIHSFNKVYDYVLGKTVFFTREEAEKALKAREGEWIDQYKGKYANALYKCSICNNAAHINELTSKWILTPFCPSCGAKMKYESEGTE